MSKATATIAMLRRLRHQRELGDSMSYTTDPEWLLDMAINRRAGWPDDPGFSRGSAMPTRDGRYPPKAEGEQYHHLCALARMINTPRLIVHRGHLGSWRSLLLHRLPRRFED